MEILLKILGLGNVILFLDITKHTLSAWETSKFRFFWQK